MDTNETLYTNIYVHLYKYVAVYEICARNAVSRSLRDMCKKHCTSRFTRYVQETLYLAVYEICARNAASRVLRGKCRKDRDNKIL